MLTVHSFAKWSAISTIHTTDAIISLSLPIDRGFQELQLNDIVLEHVIFSPIEMTLAISHVQKFI